MELKISFKHKVSRRYGRRAFPLHGIAQLVLEAVGPGEAAAGPWLPAADSEGLVAPPQVICIHILLQRTSSGSMVKSQETSFPL